MMTHPADRPMVPNFNYLLHYISLIQTVTATRISTLLIRTKKKKERKEMVNFNHLFIIIIPLPITDRRDFIENTHTRSFSHYYVISLRRCNNISYLSRRLSLESEDLTNRDIVFTF